MDCEIFKNLHVEVNTKSLSMPKAAYTVFFWIISCVIVPALPNVVSHHRALKINLLSPFTNALFFQALGLRIKAAINLVLKRKLSKINVMKELF